MATRLQPCGFFYFCVEEGGVTVCQQVQSSGLTTKRDLVLFLLRAERISSFITLRLRVMASGHLEEGDKVEFEIVQGDKGNKTENVKKV